MCYRDSRRSTTTTQSAREGGGNAHDGGTLASAAKTRSYVCGASPVLLISRLPQSQQVKRTPVDQVLEIFSAHDGTKSR